MRTNRFDKFVMTNGTIFNPFTKISIFLSKLTYGNRLVVVVKRLYHHRGHKDQQVEQNKQKNVYSCLFHANR